MSNVVQANILLKTSVGKFGKGDLIEGLPDWERTRYVRRGWATTVAVDAPQSAPAPSDNAAPATAPAEDDAPQDASEDDAEVEEFQCPHCDHAPYSTQGWLDRHIESAH